MTQITAARSRKRFVLAFLIAAAIGAAVIYFRRTSSTATDTTSTVATRPGVRNSGPGMTAPNTAVSVAVGTAGIADVPVIQQALGTVIPNFSVTVRLAATVFTGCSGDQYFSEMYWFEWVSTAS